MIKVELLTNFTQQALLDRTKAIQALNEEQIQMRKVVIQNRVGLDIQLLKEGPVLELRLNVVYAFLICFRFLITALDDMKNQVKAMSSENIPFWTLVLSWVKGD